MNSLRQDIASNPSSNTLILKSAVTVMQGKFGDSQVIADARETVASGTGTPTVRRDSLSIVAARADAAAFDVLTARAQSVGDPLEKQHFFEALAGVDDPVLAKRMVDIVLSNAAPVGSTMTLISILAAKHPNTVWTVLAPRLDDPALQIDKVMRWRLASGVAADSDDPQRVADLTSYEERSVPPEARRPFLAAIASIQRNARIRKDVLPELDRWIASRR